MEIQPSGHRWDEHYLCMEPVVITFPPLGTLCGSYKETHRTRGLQKSHRDIPQGPGHCLPCAGQAETGRMQA